MIPGANDYVMVDVVGQVDSNSFGIPATGGSDDLSQAAGAGRRYIKEAEVASGMR